MDNLRLKPRESTVGCEQPVTVAERELRLFVGSVIDLLGPEGAKVLEDIWLENWLRWRGRLNRRAPSGGW